MTECGVCCKCHRKCDTSERIKYKSILSYDVMEKMLINWAQFTEVSKYNVLSTHYIGIFIYVLGMVSNVKINIEYKQTERKLELNAHYEIQMKTETTFHLKI